VDIVAFKTLASKTQRINIARDASIVGTQSVTGVL